MGPDDEKKWGTIYLDASREATLDKLDAMQAATRQEQWNQRTQNEYLERVREKATDRAREILGQAYTERQKVLEEAASDAQRIRLEAQIQYANADAALAEAQKKHEAAQAELEAASQRHAAAQEEGFNAGIEQSREELENFRSAMGSSVAGVLAAIHGQCGAIFEGWRQEMVELLRVCVEKGTGLVLDDHHNQVLENLVIQAVRQLDDRCSITLRVHPDDEPAVADMFDAARDRMPDIGQWIVSGDPAIQLGGLIAESRSGTVDSRLELHRELVEGILQHLALPASALDSAAARTVEDALRLETEKISAMTPEAAAPAASDEECADPALAAEPAPYSPDIAPPDPFSGEPIAQEQAIEANDPLHDALPAVEEVPPLPALDAIYDTLAESAETPDPAGDAHQPPAASSFPASDDMPTGAPPAFQSAPQDMPPVSAAPVPHELTRQELEEELLPLPEDYPLPANPPHVDSVLSQGGFLDGEAWQEAARGEPKP